MPDDTPSLPQYITEPEPWTKEDQNRGLARAVNQHRTRIMRKKMTRKRKRKQQQPTKPVFY